MLSIIRTWIAGIPWPEVLKLVIDVSFKGTVLCILAGGATLLLRRSSAYIRNMIWVFALIGLILLPALSFFAPVWNIPILPELGALDRSGSLQGGLTASPDRQISDKDINSPGGRNSNSGAVPFLKSFRPHWSTWVFCIWLGGAALYLTWVFISRAGLWLVKRKAEPVSESLYNSLRNVAAQLVVRRKVKLLKTDEINAAVTIGIFNPTVILPARIEEWPDDRRRLVLSHELAHVKRCDCLIEVLALLATIFYWFNPLVWLAVKQLRIERERDCDNAVLNSGARPSDYAVLLMDIAADLGSASGPLLKLASISQGSNLKERLMCILNPKINRNTGTLRSKVVVSIMIAALMLSLSAFGIWETKAQEKPPKKEKISKEEELKKKKKMAQKKKMSAKEKVSMSWEKINEQEFSAARVVGKTIKKSGIEKGLKKYSTLKSDEDGKYYFKEGEFNTLGYMFLLHDKVDEAIAVFKLNVKAYPDSWNVYDSLGEAYMHNSDFELAVKNYKKSIELNPENENGMKMLQKIEEKCKKKA